MNDEAQLPRPPGLSAAELRVDHESGCHTLIGCGPQDDCLLCLQPKRRTQPLTPEIMAFEMDLKYER